MTMVSRNSFFVIVLLWQYDVSKNVNKLFEIFIASCVSLEYLKVINLHVGAMAKLVYVYISIFYQCHISNLYIKQMSDLA